MTVVEKMHEDEVAVTPELVRGLLQEQLPEWAELRLADAPLRGTDNALYRLGDDMVVRLPRIHWAVGAIRREYEWLPKLAAHLPLEIPTPLALGRPTEGYPWPWSVYRWLDGKDLSSDIDADRDFILDDLVEFIQSLRAINIEGSPVGRSGFPLRSIDASVRNALERLPNEYDRAALLRLWEAALKVPDWQGAPVWMHADLDGRNLLVKNGRLSGVIDWGCAGLGDPAFDVSTSWKLFSPPARAALKSRLRVDQATWDRGRGLALALAVNALSYYTVANNPALVRESERALAQILTEDRADRASS